MKPEHLLLAPALAAAFFISAASAQQSTPSTQEPLPDAPDATAAVAVHPNGPTVIMDTSMGRITCQFFQKQAPHAVSNFIGLAQGSKDWTDPETKKIQHGKPYYDNTTFHRVIPEFMIQGGDPTGTGEGDPGYSFADEFDPNLNFDLPGRLAMANSGPNTNGSQFFITETAVESLNQHYTLFGQCDESSVLVVKSIARVQRDDHDKPNTPVVLKKVTIIPEGQPVPAAAGAAGSDAVATPKKVNISGAVAQGFLAQKTPPVFPPDAKAKGIAGTVTLQVEINPEGHVEKIQVVSGPEALQQASIDAVKSWQYRPYLLNGDPVTVVTTVNVVYSLMK